MQGYTSLIRKHTPLGPYCRPMPLGPCGCHRGGGRFRISEVPLWRKDAGLYCGSRLRKGEVFAYVGLPQNLKDLKGVVVTWTVVRMGCPAMPILEPRPSYVISHQSSVISHQSSAS